jgi:hypothetical protein
MLLCCHGRLRLLASKTNCQPKVRQACDQCGVFDTLCYRVRTNNALERDRLLGTRAYRRTYRCFACLSCGIITTLTLLICAWLAFQPDGQEVGKMALMLLVVLFLGSYALLIACARARRSGCICPNCLASITFVYDEFDRTGRLRPQCAAMVYCPFCGVLVEGEEQL